jgi:hypothetical protein
MAGITDCAPQPAAYSVHIQAECYNNSNGVAWPELVHYNGIRCYFE